jgi:hypothetical protein
MSYVGTHTPYLVAEREAFNTRHADCKPEDHMSTFTTLGSISAFIEPTVRVPAWTRPDGVCPAFRWIGQPFSSCEQCGQPFWEHTHEVRGIPRVSPFSMRERHVVLTKTQRDNCRAMWDRGI